MARSVSLRADRGLDASSLNNPRSVLEDSDRPCHQERLIYVIRESSVRHPFDSYGHKKTGVLPPVC